MRVDPEILVSLLDYNPLTGKLFWLSRSPSMFRGENKEKSCKTWNTQFAGREAFTTISTTGYFYGNVFDKKHFTHRVAFAIMEGRYPDIVDHIDGDKLNNRFANLREADRSGNARNVAPAWNGSSRYLGVSWARRGSKWYACITVDGRTKSLGRHASEIDAARAYDEAATQYYGEFARLNFPEVSL